MDDRDAAMRRLGAKECPQCKSVLPQSGDRFGVSVVVGVFCFDHFVCSRACTVPYREALIAKRPIASNEKFTCFVTDENGVTENVELTPQSNGRREGAS